VIANECHRPQAPEDSVQRPTIIHTGASGGLFGNNGRITDHSKSAKMNSVMDSLLFVAL
jgi:hypothetical protein